MGKIILKNINKIYPNGVQAVYDFNLSIEDGEFIVLVGPSGCGKTTTLRMIAGLEAITSGELYHNDRFLNNIAPKDRDMAMVFQNYALYHHMTVYHNMAFSLTLRKERPEIIHERVMNAARILELVPYLNRKPKALSGGQRQRVALGRAIVRNPNCFLLDEPLSNLDAKLRGSMRQELSKLHNLLKITMIYVTHDQIEAMTLADRIVVMKDGYIQQVGTPKEIYDHPRNIFVGSFIGTPPMNFLKGVLTKEGYIDLEESKLKLDQNMFEKLSNKGYIDKNLILGIRPEQFKINIQTPNNNTLKLTADVVELLGSELLINANFNHQNIIVKVEEITHINAHESFLVDVDMKNVHIFDPLTELEISED